MPLKKASLTFIWITPHLPQKVSGADHHYVWAPPVAQLAKSPPAMTETWVLSLGWEDPLEKGKATHFNILAWIIPWTV